MDQSLWLVAVSSCALALGFGCASWILVDIYGRGHSQHLAVMEAVWPLTALYFGPVAVWGYHRFSHAAWLGPRAGRPGRPLRSA